MQWKRIGIAFVMGAAMSLAPGALLAQAPKRDAPPQGPGPTARERPADDEDREGRDDRRPPGPPQEPRPGEFDFRRPGSDRQPGPPPFGPPRDWGSVERDDPEMFKLMKEEGELERQTTDLAAKYRDAAKDQKEKVKEDLRKAVTQHFDLRQKRRALEAKRLEEELKRFRDAIDGREKNRSQIIDKRVDDLSRTNPGPDSPPGNR